MPSPLETLNEYYRVFSTLDAAAIVSFFCEPSLTIAPQGIVSAANRATLASSLAPLIDGLKARGYGRSEFVRPEVTMLGESAALVRGVAVRHTAAGAELERIPLSYVMHRGEGGWKIAVLIVSAS